MTPRLQMSTWKEWPVGLSRISWVGGWVGGVSRKMEEEQVVGMSCCE